MGYNGLSVNAGQIGEELKRELQFPTSVITYKQMSYDSMISAALNYYEQMMLKSRFSFKSHALATDEQKQYAEFMEECINDMEHSWQDFIQEVSSMNTYGFCVNEIVLRKRLKSKGSKYNDGKIGIHKLPIRSQDSITKWVYDEEQNLIGVTQSVAKTGDAVKHYLKLCNGNRAVAFCVSVAHAEHVAESFNLVGVPSESLDGTLS